MNRVDALVLMVSLAMALYSVSHVSDRKLIGEGEERVADGEILKTVNIMNRNNFTVFLFYVHEASETFIV